MRVISSRSDDVKAVSSDTFMLLRYLHRVSRLWADVKPVGSGGHAPAVPLLFRSLPWVAIEPLSPELGSPP